MKPRYRISVCKRTARIMSQDGVFAAGVRKAMRILDAAYAPYDLLIMSKEEYDNLKAQAETVKEASKDDSKSS